jgi:tRNA G10  N-methylase Trm11
MIMDNCPQSCLTQYCLCIGVLICARWCRKKYIVPTHPYELRRMLGDLLVFAARHLVIGGRLVFWLPAYRPECVSGFHSMLRLC